MLLPFKLLDRKKWTTALNKTQVSRKQKALIKVVSNNDTGNDDIQSKIRVKEDIRIEKAIDDESKSGKVGYVKYDSNNNKIKLFKRTFCDKKFTRKCHLVHHQN